MCCVPARHHVYFPYGVEIQYYVRPAVSTNGAKIVTSSTGTSTSCSAIRGARRAVREKRDGHEILGTLMTCSGTGKSKRASTATGWSTICGTETSRIGNLGAPSASCSTVCRCTCTRPPRGSARLAGRVPGGGGFSRRGASYVSPSTPLSRLLHPLSAVVEGPRQRHLH